MWHGVGHEFYHSSLYHPVALLHANRRAFITSAESPEL